MDYASNPFFNTGIVNVDVQPQASVPTTTVALDPSSTSTLVYGRSVTFDATVAMNGGGADTPTGTVAFYDGKPGAGGTRIGTAQTLSSGRASISTTSLSAASHSIYAVYMPDTSNFIGSTSAQPALVTVAPITLTVTGVMANGKVYDGTTSATLDTSQARLSGILADDSVVLAPTGDIASFADKNVGNNKPVTVTVLALAGAQGGDYIVTPPTGLAADITQAMLLVTANNQTMTYGATIPVLTFSVSGLVGGDTAGSVCTGALATTGSSSSPAGTYPITQGTLKSLDYAIRFTGASLTIAATPASAQGAAVDAPRLHGVSIGKTSKGKHKVVPAIVLTISGAVDATAVQDLGNYRLATVPRGKKKSKPIAISGATFSATTMTVTLVTSKPLVLSTPIRLTISAGAMGLSGGSIVAILSKAGAAIQ